MTDVQWLSLEATVALIGSPIVLWHFCPNFEEESRAFILMITIMLCGPVSCAGCDEPPQGGCPTVEVKP